jgi:hypothetical protein
MIHGEFSVWVFIPDDYHFPIARFVDGGTAVRIAKRATVVPGDAARVIITDGGDDCVFEWKRGEGVTWPKPTS